MGRRPQMTAMHIPASILGAPAPYDDAQPADGEGREP